MMTQPGGYYSTITATTDPFIHVNIKANHCLDCEMCWQASNEMWCKWFKKPCRKVNKHLNCKYFVNMYDDVEEVKVEE